MEMRCSRGHGVSRAAGPQCQHVRGMPWSLCLTGGTSVSGALCLGMDQGVSLDSAGSVFVAVWRQ